jgi:predicted nucleic acid-binding protein
MSYYTLDTCALLALTYEEPGYLLINELYQKAGNHEATLVMHKANLLEAYSIISKKEGLEEAIAFYDDLMQSPILFFNTLTPEFFKTFELMRGLHRLPFMDAFVVATCMKHAPEGSIVTSNRNFLHIEKSGDIPIIFFR